MKKHLSLLATLATFLFCGALLSACTPAPAGSSYALKQRLENLNKQQQRQTEQLQALQQQLYNLQQQLSGEAVVTAHIQQNLNNVESPLEPTFIPSASENEIAALTDSTTSYLAAFSDLAAGRFSSAETGFSNFLNEYPAHQYTPNARYWLASSQASQGKLQAAMSNLRQIAVDPQGQVKAPAALKQLANLYRQQNLPDQSEEILEQLRSRYPKSQEAQFLYRNEKPQ